ncbi:MAG: exo-alpha-sialidase [Rikenellaceae bacterium]|nr:exo-alpha-sialidase [Rikenellaceae bacterium]
MMRNITTLFIALFSISTFACSCAKPDAPTGDEPQPQPQPTVERTDLFAVKRAEDIAYRIPAIAVTPDGRLITVVDYRIVRSDIGVVNNGRIDLHYRISDDNGHTWSDTEVLIEGKGAEATDFMSVGYGDPCIVADRESNKVLVMSCAGNVSFQNGTRQRHQNIARFYSEDGGITWSEPEDIAESIYSQFDASSYGPVRSMFVASGRIMQSSTVKVGSHYRLYCAVLVRDNSATHMNYVLFSDDFGGSWKVLGDINEPAVYRTADEPKVEELPNGNILISSRYNGGRYYNIFTFSDVATGAGSWDEAQFSGANNNGVTAIDNSTNGEVVILPVVRNEDGKEMHILLQSLPMGPQRANVGIYYKELASEVEDYISPYEIARDWDGVLQVSTLNSAYSTMIWQKDNNLGVFYEEETYGVSAHTYGGYNMVYESLSLEEITEGKYSYRAK